jgi:hypothetical protein
VGMPAKVFLPGWKCCHLPVVGATSQLNCHHDSTCNDIGPPPSDGTA